MLVLEVLELHEVRKMLLRRYYFLVGKNEATHTAQSRLVPLLEDDENNPTLAQLEETFNIESVTKEFFDKYRELYLNLKETLDEVLKGDASLKQDFAGKSVNTVDFAKKLLGQIVFLYFLQKKGWFGVKRRETWGRGSKHFLRELFNKQHGDYMNFFNDVLEPLFYEALRLERPDDYYSRFDCRIPFLNGGLFDPIHDYDWVDTDIFLPNEVFSNGERTPDGDTGTGVLDVFDRYNFTVKEDEPLEKEVAVDPEMLGKVFENLLEVKDRRSKGTYYTPRDIVHYMCQRGLVIYLTRELAGLATEDEIQILIRFGDTMVEHDTHVRNHGRETRTYSFKLPEAIREHAALIDEKLATIRICDPAVGSGAFPVGMMSEVIRARSTLTPYIKSSSDRTLYEFKRHAVQNCLYGVDIDAGAVEIAKLRLWLSLVVDEDDIRQIKPLPNLDYKVLQGDSLSMVEHTLFNQKAFSQLEELKPLYFGETNARKKRQYKDRIDALIREVTTDNQTFDFQVYFSEVFHEKGGFDVVIANPPYVDSETMVRTMPRTRERIRSTFATARGNWDLYIPFWELGFNLTNASGNAVFITPNKWMAIGYGKELRRLLRPYVCGIGNCDKIKVFDAGNSPVIVFIQRPGGINEIRVDAFEADYRIGECAVVKHDLLNDENWGFLLSEHLPLLLRLMNSPERVRERHYAENPFTVSEAYEFKPLLIDFKAATKFDRAKYFKFVNTGTIEKYHVLWSVSPTTYLKNKYEAPVVKRQAFERTFPRRFRQMAAPKLVISGMRHFECTVDLNGDVVAGKSTVILKSRTGGDLRPVLAILNSTLMTFYVKQAFGALGIDGGINFTAQLVESLPLPHLDSRAARRLTELVNRILAITGQHGWLADVRKRAQVREYEERLDQAVYESYELTKEDLGVIKKAQHAPSGLANASAVS
jgi:hypothetical protein